jgi:hypothetical protein
MGAERPSLTTSGPTDALPRVIVKYTVSVRICACRGTNPGTQRSRTGQPGVLSLASGVTRLTVEPTAAVPLSDIFTSMPWLLCRR